MLKHNVKQNPLPSGMGSIKLLKRLKSKTARVQIAIKKHRARRDASQIRKLKLQRNKDVRAAERATKLAVARQEALDAKLRKQKANAPSIAARKQRNAKIAKGAKSAFKGLAGALKGLQKYANKR